jgi:hypothetical protein
LGVLGYALDQQDDSVSDRRTLDTVWIPPPVGYQATVPAQGCAAD